MLDVTENWWWAVLIASVAGAVGGLVYDLMLTRLGDAGLLELLSRQESRGGKRRYIDIGFLASLLVGAVAALGFLYFMTPDVTTVTIKGKSMTTREYDPFKLIAASLIVGTGGSAFITGMQQRLLKLVAQTNLDTLTGAVQAQQEATSALVAQAVDRTDDTVSEPVALRMLQSRIDSLGSVVSGVSRAAE
ncbi:MAG: hypothetical protein ACJ716_05955 [Marmoricola sp.]